MCGIKSHEVRDSTTRLFLIGEIWGVVPKDAKRTTLVVLTQSD